MNAASLQRLEGRGAPRLLADFAAIERRQRRLCRLHVRSAACIARLDAEEPFRIGIALAHLRAQGDTLLWQHIHESRAGLAAAILLGLREELDVERNDEFFRTGTAHLLAISGQHVVILVYGFGFLARFGWVPRRTTLLAAMIFVVSYALLTEARPPIETLRSEQRLDITFRRADIEAYLQVVEKIIKAQGGIECRLTTNFRSDTEILEVVNGVFESLIEPKDGVQPGYIAIEPASRTSASDSGKVAPQPEPAANHASTRNSRRGCNDGIHAGTLKSPPRRMA